MKILFVKYTTYGCETNAVSGFYCKQVVINFKKAVWNFI